MSVVVVTPPSPIITFDEVLKHIIDVPSEDKEYVEGLLAAATAWIDGPAGWLGRAIGVQLLEWQLTEWPCNDYWPIQSMLEVDSVSYIDTSGVSRTWPLPDPVWFENMPAARCRPGDIRIRYWAGYGKRDSSDPTKWVNEPPPSIKVAIMMLVAQWYETREAAVVGDGVAIMPFAVDALLHPFRVYR